MAVVRSLWRAPVELVLDVLVAGINKGDVKGVREDMTKRGRPKGCGANGYLRRNRRNAAADSLGSGEQIRQPGGVSEGAFGSKRKRTSRATYSKKRDLIWGSKSPAINLARNAHHELSTDVIHVPTLKTMTSAMTSSVFLFLFFICIF